MILYFAGVMVVVGVKQAEECDGCIYGDSQEDVCIGEQVQLLGSELLLEGTCRARAAEHIQ
jgi:hypothetical protein